MLGNILQQSLPIAACSEQLGRRLKDVLLALRKIRRLGTCHAGIVRQIHSLIMDEVALNTTG